MWLSSRYREQCKKHSLCLIVVLLVALAACDSFASPVNTPTMLPTLEPIPRFILEVQPVPSSRTTIDWFKADRMSEASSTGYEGSRPVDRVGYRSNICVYLDLDPIIQHGDELGDYQQVIPRTSLSLNNIELKPAPDPYWGHVEIIKTLEPGDTYWGAPFWLCWPAEIDLGVHRATFQFVQHDGSIKQYSWLFEIIEH